MFIVIIFINLSVVKSIIIGCGNAVVTVVALYYHGNMILFGLVQEPLISQ